MHNGELSTDILEYISADDFDRILCNEISEDDIDFKAMPSLKTVLKEFGL